MKIYYIVLLIFVVFLGNSSLLTANNHDNTIVIRMIRVFGDNEREPPILLLRSKGSFSTNIGSETITVEMDIDANVPPRLYARFVHFSADWTETNNIFYQELAMRRFSNIYWQSATYFNSYFSYRGTFTFPDLQVQIKHSGNWKVIFYDYSDESKPFAEAKFFVADLRASADISIWNSMYSPLFNVSSTSYNLETVVSSNLSMIDNNVHTCVLYKNNRFEEPFVISSRNDIDRFEYLYRYRFNTSVGGFINSQKFFRIEGLPAENEYRVIDLSNMAYFPRSNHPIRPHMSDLRRNGTFWEYDDEAVMTTDYISSSNDDYVYVEFILDPDGFISSDDVFIIGSFNNWKPSANWQMYFDEKEWLYKLRQWVRRGRHNYLYATGQLNYDLNRATRYSTDEFEGNTSLNDHFFIAFVYYKDVSLGGYDAIIAVTKQSISRKY